MTILEKTQQDLEIKVQQERIKLAFNEFLLEMAKNYTTLYHFTIPTKLSGIFKEQKLKAGKEGYVSFTRDYRLTDDDNYFNSGEYIIRLSFDGKGISENIKIQPIRDKHFPDEREEGTLKEVPLKYLKQIDVLIDTRVFPEESIRSLEVALKKFKVPFNFVKKWAILKDNNG